MADHIISKYRACVELQLEVSVSFVTLCLKAQGVAEVLCDLA